MSNGRVYIDVEIMAELSLDEAWPEGVPDAPTAEALGDSIKREYSSLSRFLSDWNLDDSATVTITVVDEESNRRTHADVIY